MKITLQLVKVRSKQEVNGSKKKNGNRENWKRNSPASSE